MKSLVLLLGLLQLNTLPGAQVELWDQESALREAATRFAQAWAEGESGELEGMMEPGGIRLRLRGEDHFSISPRQARISLRSFMDQYEGGRAEVARVSAAVESAHRGFSEIRWVCRVSGTSEPVIFTLFVAFTRTGTEWRISEVRILP
jgi:hypothetical protein